MNAADKQIADILSAYGEPFAGSVWRVQGTAVIYHKALERIAAQAGITFDIPTVVRAERDEAVMMVVGRTPAQGANPARCEWSVGEALINVNYRVSGKQAAYVWAMAEKRAKDRVILKLINLSGLVYSEEEADDFKKSNADHGGAAPPDRDSPAGIDADLRARITAASSIDAVTDLMLEHATQDDLAQLAPGVRDSLRDFAKQRLIALGWSGKRAAAAS